MQFKPDHTAIRVALWRALHVQVDPLPHVLEDELGAKLIGEKDWHHRPDMDPEFSKPMRASVVGRARFVEDLLEEQLKNGVTQYVLLGAGLDTFAQRRADVASKMEIFEIDRPDTQRWKVQRLKDAGFATASGLHFVPVDFEKGESWWEHLVAAGFDTKQPAVVVSTGVSMYLKRETNFTTLQQLAKLAKESVFAMTFMLALDELDSKERSIMEFVMKKAAESGTPFLSLFRPKEIQSLAREAGFKTSRYVPAEEIYQRYFAGRSDGLRAGNAEAFLVAST